MEPPEPVTTDRRHYSEKLRILVADADRDIAIPGLSGYAVAQAIRYSFPNLRRPLMILSPEFGSSYPIER
jgi:hypothetical protein